MVASFSETLPGLEPEFYSVPENLEVINAVKPGLIKHPMMATFDDEGRLFVAESSGVNLKKEELLEKRPHSIKRLVDSDKDGVFDKVTTFADKMTFPQGALWIYDSLYVMSPPGLWCLEDTDGDGVADSREMLVEGFEFTGNAADVHGPFLHPNGRLYWCHGRKGHEVKDPKTGELVSKAKGARIWSCQIDGGDVRVHAGGGMDNPVEIDFTDTGEIVGTVNIFFGRPRGDVLVHWLHGGTYPRRDQGGVLAEFSRTGPLLCELHNFGHVAVSGMCRYRSGALNPEWKDQWLVSHFNSNQITRTRLEKSGSSFESRETETIFQLTRPHSHLTDVLEDRNGDLLAIDTGGWFRSGCPTSQISRPEVAGGIYRIKKKGAKYRVPAYRSVSQWEKLSPIKVAKVLKAKESYLQDRAITELAIRGHSSIPEIRLIIEDKKAPAVAKRNSIWALARMRFSDSPDLIYQALKDPDPSVQIAACNALAVTRTWQSVAANQPNEMKHELERNKTISGALAKLVRSADPTIARNAAVALGAMAESRAIGSLLGRAGRDDLDRSLQHAITRALIDMGVSEPVVEALKSGNEGQQLVALWALESMAEYDLEVLDVLPFLETKNETLRENVVEIIKRHSEWDAAMANTFFAWADDLNDTRRELILSLAPAFGDTPPILDFISHLMKHEKTEVVDLAKALLPKFSTLAFQPEWEEPIRKWLKNPDSRLVALDCLRNLKTDLFNDELAAISTDPKHSSIVRVKAIRAQSSKKKALSESSFWLLLRLLSDEETRATQSLAIQILTTARLTANQRIEVAKAVEVVGPVDLPYLIKIFRLLSEEQANVLSKTLPASPGFASLNTAEIRGLFSGFPPEVRKPIDEAVDKLEAEQKLRKGKITELVSELEKGDPKRGLGHFEAGKGACNTCHKINGKGGIIGPDLSKIAAIRKPIDLFESILYPSETIARDFESYSVMLKDDSTDVGLILEESSDAISLIDMTGKVRKIERSEIKKLHRNEQSLMPVGLDLTLPREELLDLVKYLTTLK